MKNIMLLFIFTPIFAQCIKTSDKEIEFRTKVFDLNKHHRSRTYWPHPDPEDENRATIERRHYSHPDITVYFLCAYKKGKWKVIGNYAQSNNPSPLNMKMRHYALEKAGWTDCIYGYKKEAF